MYKRQLSRSGTREVWKPRNRQSPARRVQNPARIPPRRPLTPSAPTPKMSKNGRMRLHSLKNRLKPNHKTRRTVQQLQQNRPKQRANRLQLPAVPQQQRRKRKPPLRRQKPTPKQAKQQPRKRRRQQRRPSSTIPASGRITGGRSIIQPREPMSGPTAARSWCRVESTLPVRPISRSMS